MFANSKKNSTNLVLLSFLPSLFALAFLYFSFGQSLDELSQLKVSSVVQEVDEILEYGEEANNQSLMLLENPDSCEAHSVALRHLVATVPYVRSATLAKDNVIYCTSIWGESHWAEISRQRDFVFLLEGTSLLIDGGNHDCLLLERGQVE